MLEAELLFVFDLKYLFFYLSLFFVFDLFYFSLLLLAVFKQADLPKDGPSPVGCKQMEYKPFLLQ